MAINKGAQPNVDKSNLAAYPNGQVKDDDGTGDGFPLIQVTVSDIYETLDKLLRLSGQTYNGQFDNETNGYQFVKGIISLASKSDYILSLTTVAGVLNISTALAILQTNEKLIAQANADYTTETTITGNDSPIVIKTVSITKDYKAGDYVMLINNGGNIAIVQLITGDNFNFVAGFNAYLKATNNATELAGTSVAVATTPASNLYAFEQRINDPTNSAPYIASGSQAGVMSISQFNKFNNYPVPVNIGYFSGVDIGSGTVGTTYTPNGNCVSATLTVVYTPYFTVSSVTVGGGSVINVVMANAMANVNYKVRFYIESTGTLNFDSGAMYPTFEVVSTTVFNVAIRELAGATQSLKIHFEAIQI